MAYEILYFPMALIPLSPRAGTYIQSSPTNTVTYSADSGVQLQRVKHDVITLSTAGEYLFNSKQINILTEFIKVVSGRSFYMPFPNHLDFYFTSDKWWYARFISTGNEGSLSHTHVSGDMYATQLSFDFWLLVPGVIPPKKIKE